MTAPKVERAHGLTQVVERLRPILEQARDQSEADRRLPDIVVAGMEKEGLFDLCLPKEFGGVELDYLEYISLVESISAIDSAAGWIFANIATAPSQAAFLPEAGAREIYGSRVLTAGSIIPRGHAVPVEGGYQVSGRWPLTSGCHHARWLA